MPPTTAPTHHNDKLKVLLVDDDTAVIDFMAVKLGMYFQVVSTTDPAGVVALARRENPDVILCDINMPGMKGDEVAHLLSEDDATRRIPLIYLTALISRDETAELDGMFGGHVAISKSAPLAELLKCIEDVIG